MIRITFVRHGQTQGNVDLIVEGSDVVLTEHGHRQAQAVAQRLERKPVDVIISSPMKRAVETAQHIAEACNKEVILEPEARERDADVYIGKQYADVNWDELHPDVENREQAYVRAKNLLNKLQAEYDGKSIVVVSHGGFIRAIIRVALGLDPNTKIRFSIKNTALTSFSFGDYTKIRYINSYNHLDNL